MKVTTIAEALQQEEGLPIPAISGTLVALFKRTAGESSMGAYSFQNGTLKDATGEMRITFKDRDEVSPSLRGKKITLLSYQGDKGWSGVKTKSEEYKGVTSRVLWVTPTAELAEGSGTENTAPPAIRPTPTGPSLPSKGNTPPLVSVYGGTVGMAIKEACTVVNHIGTNPFGPEYSKQVWQIASNLIRVSQALEAGKLAPKHVEPKAAPLPPSLQQEPPPEPPPAPTTPPEIPYKDNSEVPVPF